MWLEVGIEMVWFKIRHFYADLIEMHMHTAHALIIV